MAQRQQQHARSPSSLPPPLATVNLHAAGIGGGADTHDVAVPPTADPQPVRCCGACTADLEALAEWLATGDITTVALESTGVSGIPLFERLETRGFEVLWVDPPQVHKLKGRPQRTGHDGQWLQHLPTCGLLAGAFRPADQVCVRRSSLRQRAMLLTDAGQHIQHRQQALTQMHLTRQHVVSDRTGVTGMAILRAMLAGERNRVTLAQRRESRGHQDQEASATALHGHWREEHLLAWAQAVALDDVSQQKIAECDRQIDADLAPVADTSHEHVLPSGPRPRTRKRNPPAFEVRGQLHRITGVDLTALEGIDDTTALMIVSEIGLDMSRWPMVTHVTAWLGVCPPQQVSGGKVLSRGTKPSANRVATA